MKRRNASIIMPRVKRKKGWDSILQTTPDTHPDPPKGRVREKRLGQYFTNHPCPSFGKGGEKDSLLRKGGEKDS